MSAGDLRQGVPYRAGDGPENDRDITSEDGRNGDTFTIGLGERVYRCLDHDETCPRCRGIWGTRRGFERGCKR